MFTPQAKQFDQFSKKGNLIPVYKEIPADLDTPVSAYLKIAKKAKYSFLLESVEGEAKVARYSFIAKNPELIIQSKNNKVKIIEHKNGKKTTSFYDVKNTPLDFIRTTLKKYKFVNIPGLPRFCGGLVGFMSYDIVRHFEKLPNNTKDDLKLPDMCMVLTKQIIIFDHLHHTMKIVHCAEFNQKASTQTKRLSYNQACKSINLLISELKQPLRITKNKHRRNPKKSVESRLKSNFTQDEYCDIVKKAKKEIRAGEIIQVVLSQRLSVDLHTEPFNIYRALRGLNPSPYMYYLNFDGIQIAGSSPELLVRCENGIVDTRPIAGTRPRGKDEKEDEALAHDLLNDPKEKAEHIMLVDLGRNDLGRVCQKGSVYLTEFMAIEKYSHVMHIVSNVRGKLHPKKDDLDVLQAAFPAGTLSGAPKIRAMEIIETLEKQHRGPYGGCIGYFSFSGNMDTCITIRTIIITGSKAYIQAGAGIVADSKPKKEYEETLNKARAQLMAIELAENEVF